MEKFLEGTTDPHDGGEFGHCRPTEGHLWSPYTNAGLVRKMANHFAGNAAARSSQGSHAGSPDSRSTFPLEGCDVTCLMLCRVSSMVQRWCGKWARRGTPAVRIRARHPAQRRAGPCIGVAERYPGLTQTIAACNQQTRMFATRI